MRIRAYVDFYMETDYDETKLLPSIGSCSVVVHGKELRFDFIESSGSIEREGALVKVSIEQRELDIETFREEWIENGFISADTSEEETERLIFECIKKASRVDEIYLEYIGSEDFVLDKEPILTDYTITDFTEEGTINLLEKIDSKTSGLKKECME